MRTLSCSRNPSQAKHQKLQIHRTHTPQILPKHTKRTPDIVLQPRPTSSQTLEITNTQNTYTKSSPKTPMLSPGTDHLKPNTINYKYTEHIHSRSSPKTRNVHLRCRQTETHLRPMKGIVCRRWFCISLRRIIRLLKSCRKGLLSLFSTPAS